MAGIGLVSPGVKVREVDLTVGRIDSISDQTGAIVGPFERGPVLEPLLIENEQDLIDLFGKPSDNDRQYLFQIIQELSNTFNARTFQPHCTLWSRVDLPLKNLMLVVKSSSQGIVSFTVKVKEIDYRQSYDKTLFIQLYNHKSLSQLQQRINNRLGENFHYHFDPCKLYYLSLHHQNHKQ